jgi:hypothetical protein
MVPIRMDSPLAGGEPENTAKSGTHESATRQAVGSNMRDFMTLYLRFISGKGNKVLLASPEFKLNGKKEILLA